MASKDGGRGVMIMGIIISKSSTAGTSVVRIQVHWSGQLKRSLLPLRDHVGSIAAK